MKVAFKLISCVIIGIIVLVAIDAVISIRREVELFQSEMHHDALMLGYAMKDLVEDICASKAQNMRWLWSTIPTEMSNAFMFVGCGCMRVMTDIAPMLPQHVC